MEESDWLRNGGRYLGSPTAMYFEDEAVVNIRDRYEVQTWQVWLGS